MFSKMMEITTCVGCGLQCKFCPQEMLMNAYFGENDRKRPAQMSFDTFRICVDKIPREIDVHFSGMCEPWLNPDCTRMLVYAKEKGHQIHVFSSLVGMTKNDYDQLRDIPLKTFVLHIPDEERHSTFHISETYLMLLRRILDDHQSGKIKINSFSCHGSVHPAIKQMINESRITINSQMNDRAGNASAALEMPMPELRKGKIECKWCGGTALDRNVLLPDGTVLLCCMDYGMKFPLGNLLEQSYEEVSEGKVKKAYRNMMKTCKEGTILCRYCSRSVCPEMSKQSENSKGDKQ